MRMYEQRKKLLVFSTELSKKKRSEFPYSNSHWFTAWSICFPKSHLHAHEARRWCSGNLHIFCFQLGCSFCPTFRPTFLSSIKNMRCAFRIKFYTEEMWCSFLPFRGSWCIDRSFAVNRWLSYQAFAVPGNATISGSFVNTSGKFQ